MKTKLFISSLVFLLSSLAILFTGQVFATCSEGDYGPGCDTTTSTTDPCESDPYSCECTNNCDDPTTQTTYPPTTYTTYPPTTYTTYPPTTSTTYPPTTSTTYPPTTSTTYTTYTTYTTFTTFTTGLTTTSDDKPRTYYYCGDLKAKNGIIQSQCRAQNNARPQDPCYRDDSLCDYGTTTATTNKPGTIYYYCDNPQATNQQTLQQCIATNAVRVSIDRCEAKIDAPTCTFKQKEPYCTDNKANNQETLAQCKARIDQAKQECVSDNTSCTYNELYYCTDKNAINYDPTGSQCRASLKDPAKQQCIADNKSCIYNGTNATLCLQQVNGQPVTFATMPDFSNMVSFNAFFKICSNNGIYVYTGSTFQTINGQNQQSFSGFCYNSSSTDSDPKRCTYTVENKNTTTTGTGEIDGISGITSLNGINSGDQIDGISGITSLNGINSGDQIDGINGINTGSGYFIAGVVRNEKGLALSNIQVNLNYNGNIISTATDTSGNYIFTGLGVGGYSIRPVNSQPYIFPDAKSVTITQSNVNVDFSGISLVGKPDNAIAELLNRAGDSTTSTSSETSLNDWINSITNNKNGFGVTSSGTGTSDITGNLSDANGYSFSNVFSGNSLFSLLENGYLPLASSYSPVSLSLIPKYADKTSICGDGEKQQGETCDDGINNGKVGYCSSDCLYVGEVRFITKSNPTSSSAINTKSGSTGFAQGLQSAGNVVSSNVQRTLDIMGTSIEKVGDSIDSIQEELKKKIIENTSPRTRKVLKKAAVVAEVTAKYSVVGVVSLLGVLAASLHVMVFKSQWMSYTVQDGDTFDSLGDKFTMTERAMKAQNSKLKKGGLRPGMKIKVRNRHFIEKDYLDQLKSVLKDGLEKRHYGKMSSKIDKMFAKK